MNARSLTLLACAMLCACAPDPKPVVVLVFNPQRNAYEPRQVELKTVEDIVSLEGPVVRLLGGAYFAFDASDPGLASAANDPDKLREAMTKREGEPVEVAYIEREGVLIPADFHSLNLATTYYNFERSFDFFSEIGGLKASDFKTREVHYFPTFDFFGTNLLDNALFFTPMQGFMILPFEELNQIPLAINLGVVGHEFSHAVFNYRVFGSDPMPGVYDTWSSDLFACPGLNLLDSLNEGLADLFGVGITCSADMEDCDPTFMSHSLSGSDSDARRVDGVHCMTSGLERAMLNESSIQFSDEGAEYLIGSVFASALWRAASDGEVVTRLGAAEARRQLYEGVYRALAESAGGGIRALVAGAGGAMSQSDFRLQTNGSIPGVLDALVAGMTDPVLQAAVCSAFLDRFGVDLDDIKQCPATARSFGECTP